MSKVQMSKQISALERLQNFPAVFRGSDLTIRSQWTSKNASQYLYLWKRRNLVADFGGHSDVYANLVVNRDADWEKALLMAMPSSIIVGIEALRREGWTTQIPTTSSVAVRSDQRVFKTLRFDIVPCSVDWFDAIKPAVAEYEVNTLNWLPPAWALADLLRQSPWGTFGLWPDDIEWDEISEKDEDDWLVACHAFGMDTNQPLLSFREDSRESNSFRG